MFFRLATFGPTSRRVALPNRPNKEAKSAAGRHTARRVASVGIAGREDEMNAQQGPWDPNRLTVEQAAQLLSAAGRKRIEVESLQQDLADGAPRNVDGTINLVQYAAWLVREMGRSDLNDGVTR